jgi:methylmalonyl-CoA mutase
VAIVPTKTSLAAKEVIRATEEEKAYQISMLQNLHVMNKDEFDKKISQIQDAAINNTNIFDELMEVAKYASLGQITSSLFAVGGQYRRNM